MTAIHRHITTPTTPQTPGHASPMSAIASLLRAVRLTRPPAAIEAKPPVPDCPHILTDRLVIRPLLAQDKGEFERVQHTSKDHLARFCPLSKGDRHDLGEDAMFAHHLELAQAGDRTGRAWRRMLFDHQGRLVGAINLNDITRGLENTSEFVLWLAHDAVGKGLALEAMRAAMNFAFADAPDGLGLHKIIGLICPENRASVKLADSAGFEPGIGEEPVELVINDLRVKHDLWVAYAPVPPSIDTPASPQHNAPLVRGLWSMIDLESKAAHNMFEKV